MRTSSGQQDARTRSFSGQRDGQFGFTAPQQYADPHQRSSLQEQSAPFAAKPAAAKAQPPPAPAAPKPKKQPEINLIDDFGPSQQAPLVASQTQPASYVDPFAAVASPAPLKPTATITLDPFAPHNVGNSMQRPYVQPPAANMNAGAARAGNYQQQQAMGMRMHGMGAPVQQQTARGSFVGQQQPAVAGGMGHVNYNISQLMNPVDVNSDGQRNQPAKSINIDAFASMGR
ncbi:hypothetical protein BBJ28_00006846 [Nothophytophthora sp. Chile5]|nr:hypothetical protein BBJ28_00006846 [Nothophytophthora sp. Chile5]